MKLPRTFPRFLLAACLFGFLPSAQAVMVNLLYRGPGENLGLYGTAGAAPPAAGGGQLQALMETAAHYWESAFRDDFTLTLEYGWYSLPTGRLAEHRLMVEGGTPHRESGGTIAFDNDGSIIWFIDSTPLTNVEYTTFTNYTANLGGGTINTGRVFSAGKGDALRQDLLSSALHEIGHALGLSSANDAYQAEAGTDLAVNIRSPRPFANSKIGVDDAHLTLENALLYPTRPLGVRRYASQADILAIAEVSGFTQINLLPQIPEPGVLGLLLFATAACAIPRRRPVGRNG